MRKHGAAASLEKAWPIGDVRFKIAPSSIDQVIADVGSTIPGRSKKRRLACALDRAQRDAHLGIAAGRGQLFDRLPLPVTAEKIHSSVRARRVALQNLFDEAHGFDVRLPIECRAQANTRDGVGDRYLGNALALVLGSNRILGGRLPRREVLVDGGANRQEAQPVLANAVEQLHDERRVEERGQDGDCVFGVFLHPRDVDISGAAFGTSR